MTPRGTAGHRSLGDALDDELTDADALADGEPLLGVEVAEGVGVLGTGAVELDSDGVGVGVGVSPNATEAFAAASGHAGSAADFESPLVKAPLAPADATPPADSEAALGDPPQPVKNTANAVAIAKLTVSLRRVPRAANSVISTPGTCSMTLTGYGIGPPRQSVRRGYFTITALSPTPQPASSPVEVLFRLRSLTPGWGISWGTARPRARKCPVP